MQNIASAENGAEVAESDLKDMGFELKRADLQSSE
jgi:hypothetical protein